jgi:hypothetical protein
LETEREENEKTEGTGEHPQREGEECRERQSKRNRNKGKKICRTEAIIEILKKERIKWRR